MATSRSARTTGWAGVLGSIVLSLIGLGTLGAHPSDPGIEIAVDLESVSLRARDVRSGEAFEKLAVVIGSPAAPTPRGSFRTGRVLLQPSWTPSESAREFGATAIDASLSTPMGVAKIPFAGGGSVALHGGGHAWALGKPVSSGCVRVHDADLLRLLAWMEVRGALGATTSTRDGERERSFVRPVHITVR